MKLINIIRC